MADNLPELDSLIDEKINLLIKQRFDSRHKIGHIRVQFLEKDSTKAKKKSGWFGKTDSSEEVKIWESWLINIDCLPIEDITESRQTQTRPNAIELSVQSFEHNLHRIIHLVDTHKDHIPPITSLESSPFPYNIEVQGNNLNAPYASDDTTQGEHDGESWGKYIKKMLD